jgi:hypothetical protein
MRHDAFSRDVPVIDSLFNRNESSESCGKDAGIELLALLKYDYSIVQDVCFVSPLDALLFPLTS